MNYDYDDGEGGSYMIMIVDDYFDKKAADFISSFVVISTNQKIAKL